MGHTVLAVPVPALDDVVRERTAHYDSSFVSADPDFVHAHITVLSPWIPSPTPVDLGLVASLLRRHPPFEVALEEVGEFPDGVLHLRPRPEQPLRALTLTVAQAFPQHPPYAGRYPDPVPHLTVDRRSETVTAATVRTRLAHLLPLAFVVDRVDLQWWANDDCRLLHSWRVGDGP